MACAPHTVLCYLGAMLPKHSYNSAHFHTVPAEDIHSVAQMFTQEAPQIKKKEIQGEVQALASFAFPHSDQSRCEAGVNCQFLKVNEMVGHRIPFIQHKEKCVAPDDTIRFL